MGHGNVSGCVEGDGSQSCSKHRGRRFHFQRKMAKQTVDAYFMIPPNKCPLRYGSATPAGLTGFTVVYVLTYTRSVPAPAARSPLEQICKTSISADARTRRSSSAEFNTKQTGSHTPNNITSDYFSK